MQVNPFGQSLVTTKIDAISGQDTRIIEKQTSEISRMAGWLNKEFIGIVQRNSVKERSARSIGSFVVPGAGRLCACRD
jgi:hypothetical protein